VIKSLGILKKGFSRQIIFLTVITTIFALVGTYVWMIIMMKIGIWSVGVGKERYNSFIRQYFFNLFPVLLTFSGWVLIYFLFHYVKGVRKEEQLKTQYQLQMIELEAKALRAQMNPHFIFNCLNSIKSLMQENEMDKGVQYLTTFSKLIRTLFNNADKKEISLHDELETCKLYLELEAMRFDSKFSYSVNIADNIDIKSIYVPALIVQPFIENAIWHGIVPKKIGGHVDISVCRYDRGISVTIDDDGIGREASMKMKSGTGMTHQSRGIHLTQSRLQLNNLLKQMTAQLNVLDKKNEGSIPAGTKVIISFDQSSFN